MSAARDGADNLPAEERRKIGEVIHGQGDNSTSWMYEQPKKNAEDFLLGKPVKSLEELAEISRDDAEETPAQRLARLDMQAKYREDPLNLMRQHEIDKRNALLQNTAKIKKLQRLIEKQKRQQIKRDQLQKRKGDKSKHHHHHHHHHRRSHHESKDNSLSSSSDSEDDAILDKFISLLQQQEPGANVGGGVDSLQRHMEKEKEEKSSKKKKKKSNEHATKKKHKHHKHHDREKHSHKRSKSPVWTEEGKKTSRSDSPAPIIGRASPSPTHRSPPPTAGKRWLSPPPPGERRSSPPPAAKRRVSPPPPPSKTVPPPRRSREEMAALRAQMAADAKERERERVERYQRHQTETKKEEALEIASRSTHGASFLKGLTLAHVASSSVEEGVHRKANSRQRVGMEENFLRQ